MEECTPPKCLICEIPLTGSQTKFCCRKHAMKWHNARQIWELRSDREVHNARKKAKYAADPKKGAAAAKAWREAHPEKYRGFAENAKRRYWQSPWRKLVIAAKGRAAEKNLPFDLTFEWAQARWTGFCEVSGLPFITEPGTPHRMFAPSLDQIAPAKGYTQDNSRFVLRCVNSFKLDGDDETMYAVAEAIVRSKTSVAD